jgi:hypothetical protein
MAGAPGDSVGISLYTDTKGRTSIKGLYETRRALMAMGMERNLFEKWIKQSAILAAREATKSAPVITGRLATSIRAQASKKYTSHGATKRAYGGVVLGRTPYARAVSYGHYYVAGQTAKESKKGTTPRVWRETKRTRGNPYMVQGRERAKPAIVRFWAMKIKQWTQQKGFETSGL